MSKTRCLETFLTTEDEANLSEYLKSKYSDILFLDCSLWEGGPQFAPSINQCKKDYCYIWNRSIYPHLPTFARKNGLIEGPSSGIVIQFHRSMINNENILLSGRIAVGYDASNKEFDSFVKDVFNFIKKITKPGVYLVKDQGIVDKTNIWKEYRVSESIKIALKTKQISGMKAHNVKAYFAPVD